VPTFHTFEDLKDSFFIVGRRSSRQRHVRKHPKNGISRGSGQAFSTGASVINTIAAVTYDCGKIS